MSMLIFYAKSILFNSLVAVVVCWLPKRALFWRINRILSKCVSQETQISHRKIIGSASTFARLRWYLCSMTKHLLISGENKLAIQLTFQNILILTHHKKTLSLLYTVFHAWMDSSTKVYKINRAFIVTKPVITT